MANTIAYFDCNASFGAPRSGGFAPCPGLEELVSELEWNGVDRALVHHALMREQSPVVGNAVLCDELALLPDYMRDQIAGTWAILPPHTRELPPQGEFFEAMSGAGIRALWAFPTEHRYLLNRLTFGTLLDEASERRMPLFIPRDAGGTAPADTWRLVTALLAEYPELTCAVAGHGPWGEDRFFRPLLARYPGFCLDISRYELDCGLRDLVSTYGAARLLYGSGFPSRPMGGARTMLAHAEIDEDARRAIAGGNLRGLLEGVRL